MKGHGLGVALLAVSVVLGIAGDVVFNGEPLGLNVFLFACCFVAGLALLLRVHGVPLHQGRRWMAAPLLLFSAAFLWHDSPLLTATNLLALAGAVALGGLRRSRHRPQDATVSDYAGGLVSAGAGAAVGALFLLKREVPWGQASRIVRAPRALAVARGLGLGVPVIAVFGGLFFAADSVFAHYTRAAVPAIGNPLPQIALVLLISWLSAGLLRDLLAARDEDRALPADRLVPAVEPVGVGLLEVGIVLAALDLLFLAFVLVQARYLFGGSVLVESQAHLSYSHYARQGFFELVVVSLLVLPVLLAANALIRHRLIRALCAVLVALELVVAFSAFWRLRIYEQQYGLTELRIYAIGVVAWLVVVFVWATMTVLRGRVRRFAVGAVVAGFVATGALNAVNPDALIARTNLSRPQVDITYLAHLSDDAVPTLVDRSSELPATQRTRLLSLLARRHRPQQSWLSWNDSRRQARAALDTLRH